MQVFPHGCNKVKKACVSYYALCKVLEALTMTPRGTVTPKGLLELIVKHLTLFKAGYGPESFVPKFHFSLHLPEQLLRWSMLVACFTHERKHKEAKRYIDKRMNIQADFEKSVMQDCLYAQTLALDDDHTYPSGQCLLREHKAPAKIAAAVQGALGNYHDQVFSAVHAKASNFLSCHVRDVVYVQWDDITAVGQIEFLSRISNSCSACVRFWTKMPQLNMYMCTGGDAFLVPLSDIIDTCVYSMRDDVACVVPPRGLVRV
jgi:hypothetical protein